MKLMSRTTVRAKGRITLPTDSRRAARLEEGDILEAEITAEGILLRPQRSIDATQAWFWSQSWQAAEREDDADRKAGRIDTFDSREEMIDSLHNHQSRSACE
jgi:AbrB family looped-hinge helix DNA binding protein